MTPTVTANFDSLSRFDQSQLFGVVVNDFVDHYDYPLELYAWVEGGFNYHFRGDGEMVFVSNIPVDSLPRELRNDARWVLVELENFFYQY